jgi:hypothetical protein
MSIVKTVVRKWMPTKPSYDLLSALLFTLQVPLGIGCHLVMAKMLYALLFFHAHIGSWLWPLTHFSKTLGVPETEAWNFWSRLTLFVLPSGIVALLWSLIALHTGVWRSRTLGWALIVSQFFAEISMMASQGYVFVEPYWIFVWVMPIGSWCALSTCLFVQFQSRTQDDTTEVSNLQMGSGRVFYSAAHYVLLMVLGIVGLQNIRFR